MRHATPSGQALSRWAAFPVGRSPRPLVLLSPRVATCGFETGEAKLAWGDGAITVTADVPAGVLAVLPRREPRAVGPDVVLDRARRVDAPFRTDRGPLTLPAWRLDGAGLLDGGCVVLDPGVEAWWSLSDEPAAIGTFGATVNSTGRTVQFPATGGWYTDFLYAEFEEYAAYVVGRGVTRERVPRAAGAVPLVLRGELVTGELVRPLRDRVLITERGDSVAVVVAD